MRFLVTGRDRNGPMGPFEVTAETADDARARIEGMGITVTTVVPAPADGAPRPVVPRRDPRPGSGSHPPPTKAGGRSSTGIATLIGVVVFVGSNVFCPPKSEYWSDRGPHMLVMGLVAAVAAGAAALVFTGSGDQGGGTPPGPPRKG
jgi:hypothetical protein